MRTFITIIMATFITVTGCDNDSKIEDRDADLSLERIVASLADDEGLVHVVDLVDAIDPDAGGACKFSSDSKSCGMVCDTIGITCVVRDDAADCKICTPAGCASFKTDGCDPTTWP